MKKISVHLTEQQIAVLQTRAKESGLKFAELLRRIIDAALEQRK